MLGLVIRVVEAQISLSIDVMRRSAAFAGRLTGWALNEVASGLAPDQPRPTASRAPSAPAPPPPAPPAAPEPPLSVAVETPAPPEPTAEETPPEPEPPATLSESEPASAAEADTVVSDIAGGEEGATIEHEPGPGTSVRARTPHSSLNNPVSEPDLTEWPDPYDHREDPRDPGEEMVFGRDAAHTPPGATSTSEPHPSQDPEAEPAEGPKRDKVDQ